MASKRILLFPFPVTGHIKPYLELAKMLSGAGLDIVFLNTEYNHSRIENLKALTSRFPTIHFETIPDGLPPDRPRDILGPELVFSLRNGTKPLLRRLIQSINDGSSRPISCIISDPVLSAPVDVSEELGITMYSFCTFSACYLSIHFWISKFVEEAQIPYADDNPLVEIHGQLPVNQGTLRRKDLPGSIGWSKKHYTAERNPMNNVNQTISSRRTAGLIINTFNELESSFLTYLSSIFKKVYTIGPIHTLSKPKLGGESVGFWKQYDNETTSVISWLDSKPSKSVIFISFGTIVKFKLEELMEFCHGLINSRRPFLFVLRSELIHGENEMGEKQLIEQLMCKRDEDDNDDVMVVKWAPQEKVLNHPAVGLFLTHAGWNSVVESIVAGVPMICRPVLGDQHVIANWVENIWKIGLEMKEECNREKLEMMIRVLMEDNSNGKKSEILKSIENFSKFSKESIGEGGSSFQNMTTLVEELKK